MNFACLQERECLLYQMTLKKFRHKSIFFAFFFPFSKTSQGKATHVSTRINGISLKTNADWKDWKFGHALNRQHCSNCWTLINDDICLLLLLAAIIELVVPTQICEDFLKWLF